MEPVLTLIDRFKTPITVVLVAAIVVGGGVIGLKTLQIRSLMNQAASSLGSSDEVQALKATQVQLEQELAQLQTQATALAGTESVSKDSEKPSGSTGATTQTSEMVHLNSATLAQLETLPGIGATKAQAILDYRTSHGPFTSMIQLLNVKGIGEATLAKMKPQLTLD